LVAPTKKIGVKIAPMQPVSSVIRGRQDVQQEGAGEHRLSCRASLQKKNPLIV